VYFKEHAGNIPVPHYLKTPKSYDYEMQTEFSKIRKQITLEGKHSKVSKFLQE